MRKQINANSKEKYLKELEVVEHIRELISKNGSKQLKGKIHSKMSQGKYPQYYLVDEMQREQYPHGRYLRFDEIRVAREYSQMEYESDILKQLDRSEKRLRKLISLGDANIYEEINGVYNDMPSAKRILVNPVIPNDEKYIEKWENSFAIGENSYQIENGIETERGELVRSKSEKMIADKLYMNNIPYVYEAKLKLKKGVVVYPDFAILNVRTRETFYLEHFGMMDNVDYCKKALEKIDLYEDNNYIPVFDS